MKKPFALLLLVLLAGCVTEGGSVDPMSTSEGREKALDSYVKLAIGYVQQGDPARAKAPLGKALELDPNSAAAHSVLAVVFQHEMEYELADKHFRQSLSSGEARNYNNYGSFLFERGRYAEAFANFQKASEDTLYAERARVFENMGLVSLKLGNVEDAKGYFTRAVRLDSRRPGSLFELASLAYDEQQYVPAKQYYESYSKIYPQTARSLLLGIRLARVFNKPEEAAPMAERLGRLYPASAEYKTYLSESQ